MNHINKVKEFIIENFLFGDADKIKEDTSFLESGIIDSTGILELVSFLEEAYGIIFSDEELIPENLDSLINIAQFIERKTNSGKD